MADRTVKVKLVADTSEYTAGLVKAAAQTRTLGQDVEKSFSRDMAPVMRRSGEKSGGLLARGINNGLVRNSPLIAAGVSAALAAGAPVVLAGATALFAGIGGVAAAQSTRVRSAWTDLGHEIRDGAVQDAAVLVPTYEAMANKIGAAFERMRPEIRDAFEAAAPLIDNFTDSLTEAAENALPGLVRAVERGGPVIEGLGSLMEDIGTGISDFLDAMSDNSGAAGQALELIGEALAEALPLLGELLGTGAELATIVLPPLVGALGAVRDIATALGPVLPVVVAGLGGLKIAQSLAGPIQTLAQRLAEMSYSSSALAGTAGQASTALSGLGKALPVIGTVLGLFAAGMARSEEQSRLWSAAIAEGGEAAAAARAEMSDFGRAMEVTNSGWEGFVAGLAGGGAQVALTANALAGVTLAGKAVNAASTQAAVSIRDVTQAMIEQADQVLAAIDSQFAYRNSVNQLEDAQVALNTAIAENGPNSEAAQRAQLALEEQSYRTALAYGQQQADLSGLGTETSGYAQIIQEEALAELYRLHDAAGPQMQAAIATQIDALEDSGVRLAQTGRQTDATRGQVNNFIDAVNRIPLFHATRVTADTAGASTQVSNFQRQIDNLHGKTVQIMANWANGGTLAGPARFSVNADGNLYERHDAQIARGGDMRVWAEPETGGEAYIPLSASKRGRSLGIWRETGRRLGAPEAKYYADGGFNVIADWTPFLSTAAGIAKQMSAGGGPAGSGVVGGAWGSIWQYVRTRIPEARINSTYRAGDPGYHGRGKAIDFGYGSGPGGAGSAGLASINRLLHDGVGRNLAELIYDGIGDDRPDLKNGRPLTYSASTRAQHRNHVHAAVYDQGGPLYPGYTMAYNGTGSTEWVGKTREFSGGGGGRGGGGVGGGMGAVTVYAQFGAETIEARAVRVVTDALTVITDREDWNG